MITAAASAMVLGQYSCEGVKKKKAIVAVRDLYDCTYVRLAKPVR